MRREHRIICRGVFEERVYDDGRLVDVRRYALGPGTAEPRHGWRPSGKKIA